MSVTHGNNCVFIILSHSGWSRKIVSSCLIMSGCPGITGTLGRESSTVPTVCYKKVGNHSSGPESTSPKQMWVQSCWHSPTQLHLDREERRLFGPYAPFLATIEGRETLHTVHHCTVSCLHCTHKAISDSQSPGRYRTVGTIQPNSTENVRWFLTLYASAAACGNWNRFLERRFPVVQISTGHKVHANSLQPVRFDRGFIIIVFQ